MSKRYAKKQLKRWQRAYCDIVFKIYDLDAFIHKEVDKGPYRHEWDWRKANPGVKEKLEHQRDVYATKCNYYYLNLYIKGAGK